jgi:hypothetical protein
LEQLVNLDCWEKEGLQALDLQVLQDLSDREEMLEGLDKLDQLEVLAQWDKEVKSDQMEFPERLDQQGRSGQPER